MPTALLWLTPRTHTAAAPGTIKRFDVTASPLPAAMYGVEGQDFQTGTNLSPAMELAIKNVVRDVLREAHRFDSWPRRERAAGKS